MNLKYNKSFLIISIMILFILTLLHLISAVLFDNSNFNLVNFLIFTLSTCIVFFSVHSLKEKGVNTYNLFFFVFFFFLIINTYNISNLQIEKTLLDMYYYFVGPIVFGACLYFAENVTTVKETNFKKVFFNPNKLVLVVLIVYIACWIYIYSITGIRLLGDNSFSGRSDVYTIPGISGIVAIMFWFLLIYVPHINRSLQISVISSVILLQGVLLFKRGEIVRTLLFLAICYVLIKGKKILSRKLFIRSSLILLLILFVFTATGEIRQSARMGDSGVIFSVSDTLQSNIRITSLDWLYGYTAINFDVLSVDIKKEPKYAIEAISLPIKRIFKGNTAVENYYSELNYHGLSGFNATTFLHGYIRDLGVLYFIEIFLLGVVVGCVVVFSKKFNYIGLYAYIILLTGLTFFGDYYMNPSNFIAICITSIFLYYTNTTNNNKMNSEKRLDSRID